MKYKGFPKRQGLYDPDFEHDSCGVGFVCNIKGTRSYDIVDRGMTVLEHMSHRGAVGADPLTGDGAGILMQIPHEFYSKICTEKNVKLPAPGKYGTGIVFMPSDEKKRALCRDIFEKTIDEEGQELLLWREVPVDDSIIGKAARRTKPCIMQVFIKSVAGAADQMTFERKLYIIRKSIENKIFSPGKSDDNFFYITNLSSRTVSYKGLLTPHQLRKFYRDLNDNNVKSSLALVHSRYSTNTFPTWDLAQPFRFLAHNGEINTLRGNINWFRARERQLKSTLFGEDIEKLKPIIVEGGSDSAVIDNVFELLTLSGRSLPHTAMMLIPDAWEQHDLMDPVLKDFYRYHACFMEPWDGPAAIAFTDGRNIGAVLDRNGLRPARYIVTRDDCMVMASEAGVLDIEPDNIQHSGRLGPGKMLFVDADECRIIEDAEIKNKISGKAQYGEWNKKYMVDIGGCTVSGKKPEKTRDMLSALKAFGYTREDLNVIMKPMAEDGKEPIGSMGNDTPPAFLSKEPQVLYNYFKQLFAQVTNPPIDSIREKVVMTLASFVGPGSNILEEVPEHARKLCVKNPVLTDDDMSKIRGGKLNGFKARTIYTLFDPARENGLENALDRICLETEQAVANGYAFIILSDRGIDREKAAVPALLSASAVHQYLVRKAIRSQVGIIAESGEPREVHHYALLFGYGVDCINPYLAYETIEYMAGEGDITCTREVAIDNYRKAVSVGILKILSKMGISTLRSYRGAQIFEALGLDKNVVDKYFTGTVSRIGGIGIKGIEEETTRRHREAYSGHGSVHYLSTGGMYQWKKDGEFHLWNPESIASLQDAVRKGNQKKYLEFASIINDQAKNPSTLRGLLKFKKCRPIPLEKVDPVSEIVRRFVTGAMSFGSISRNTHEALAIAMNKLGGKSNTGEGGEDPARFSPLPNGDSVRSAVKQVASGRFGVTANYLVNADEIQIKIAQGAKPGEGGQLPGHKVSATIAHTRYTSEGVTLISPPPHHDIYSIEDLAQLIFDLKNVNPSARISVKLVSEIGVGTIAAGVAKGHADMILISGGDGGTGASPRSSIRHAGMPWELGLSETHQTLVLNDLRSRVRLQTDGQMRTGRDVAIAAILGAEEYGFGTAVLITLGCVMLRHCHLNSCSLGVATQDKLLQKRFQGRVEYVTNYMRFVAEELRGIMASLGIRKMDDLIGRTDLVELDTDMVPEKAKGVDFSRILYKPKGVKTEDMYRTISQNHGVDDVMDRKLIEQAKASIDGARQSRIEMKISNVNRTVGAMLSGRICSLYGERGLPEDTIKCKFRGIAGQSFGAFLAKGITFELEGIANDYVGKGISGGNIIIYPSRDSHYKAEDNIIIGNTTFYGAISGEAYIRGIAGERFCIRNSGLYAVVEGVGDHGCEYMTGGRVIILGETGRNFGAGMSGGIAYVYDEKKILEDRYNREMVLLEPLNAEDRATLYFLVNRHHKFTDSPVADKVLRSFNGEIKKFIKVMPVEYKQVLKSKQTEKKLDLLEVSDG